MKSFLITALLQAAPATGAKQPGLLDMLWPMAIVIFIFYFLVFRPQQKQAKEHKMMLTALQKDDNVVTTGGIHGKVIEVNERTLLLEIADKVRVRVNREAVTGVLKAGGAEKSGPA